MAVVCRARFIMHQRFRMIPSELTKLKNLLLLDAHWKASNKVLFMQKNSESLFQCSNQKSRQPSSLASSGPDGNAFDFWNGAQNGQVIPPKRLKGHTQLHAGINRR